MHENDKFQYDLDQVASIDEYIDNLSKGKTLDQDIKQVMINEDTVVRVDSGKILSLVAILKTLPVAIRRIGSKYMVIMLDNDTVKVTIDNFGYLQDVAKFQAPDALDQTSKILADYRNGLIALNAHTKQESNEKSAKNSNPAQNAQNGSLSDLNAGEDNDTNLDQKSNSEHENGLANDLDLNAILDNVENESNSEENQEKEDDSDMMPNFDDNTPDNSEDHTNGELDENGTTDDLDKFLEESGDELADQDSNKGITFTKDDDPDHVELTDSDNNSEDENNDMMPSLDDDDEDENESDNLPTIDVDQNQDTISDDDDEDESDNLPDLDDDPDESDDLPDLNDDTDDLPEINLEDDENNDSKADTANQDATSAPEQNDSPSQKYDPETHPTIISEPKISPSTNTQENQETQQETQMDTQNQTTTPIQAAQTNDQAGVNNNQTNYTSNNQQAQGQPANQTQSAQAPMVNPGAQTGLPQINSGDMTQILQLLYSGFNQLVAGIVKQVQAQTTQPAAPVPKQEPVQPVPSEPVDPLEKQYQDLRKQNDEQIAILLRNMSDNDNIPNPDEENSEQDKNPDDSNN